MQGRNSLSKLQKKKYSDWIADWLTELGYSHVFFVAGGNIMHLIESFAHSMKMVPVVNEVATTIAAEYFNEANRFNGKKSIALVTAGPGITNAISGMAGAYLESRELLVIGGQVKSQDLSRGTVRQSGIQEIDGISLVSSITNRTVLIDKPVSQDTFYKILNYRHNERKGPIFLEICLDTQARVVGEIESHKVEKTDLFVSKSELDDLDPLLIQRAKQALSESKRPVFLVGSGVDIKKVSILIEKLTQLRIPIMTSWNAADRISSSHELNFGRPNNWGQRRSNVILQQADLLIAAGTRMGFQATGFNFEEFLPLGKLIQIDIDENELSKGHPKVDIAITGDAFEGSMKILSEVSKSKKWIEWIEFCKKVDLLLPVVDSANTSNPGFVEIFGFIHKLSDFFDLDDVIIPSSSGGGSTVTMQVTKQKGLPQRIITNKGLASMGYGLCGAIGAAFSTTGAVWFVEGDGSLTQNIQELGVLSQFNLNVKIILISNNGYASIRSTQRNYFNGNYIGCDPSTGLNMPHWNLLAQAYGLKYFKVSSLEPFNSEFIEFLNLAGPAIIEVPVDPEQTFYPKITSRISETKGMESSPLHLMTPPLSSEISDLVFKYL
jgi:acetolactate synthase-1/2/3 large subunit